MFLYMPRLLYWIFSMTGIRPVCQSLQWSTSGMKSIFGSASRTARQKYAYLSPSSVPEP